MAGDNTRSTQAPQQVLSTLNQDGSRRWLRPRLSKGRFWNARRTVAYLLIALFTIVPYLSISGTPVLRLDVAERKFHVLGRTFLPGDTLLMALLIICIFVTIFLVTALFGRIWCGWACPQTVYMEFLYRPIERLFDGAPGKKQSIRASKGVRRALKYTAFFFCSLFLAHTFLAYFVDPRDLIAWMQRSPFEHPTAFLIVAATTAAMMFDFCFFREQVCLVACPYGRFQAALLDRHSLIVTYDDKRGEPRGRKKRKPSGDVALPVVTQDTGDCIDCHMCVTTCPTGIDIRDGLQMECIGCAQCIDACDSVMDKIARPRGLIRYSSQAAVTGQTRHIIRPRTIVYPLVLIALFSVFLFALATKTSAEAQLLPRQGATFYELADTDEIANQVRLRLTNRSDQDALFILEAEPPAHLMLSTGEIRLEAGGSEVVGFQLVLPRDAFTDTDARQVNINITGPDGFEKVLNYRMLGPRGPKP